MCKGQLVAVKCTQESCCATVGAAWGVPCSKCPEKRDCSKGFFKDPRTGKCTDINECRGIPNICAMGTCVNTDGSYHCECGTGRKYNSQNFECSGMYFNNKKILNCTKVLFYQSVLIKKVKKSNICVYA